MKKLIRVCALLLALMFVLAGCGSNGKTMADAKAVLGEYRTIPVVIDNPEVTDEDVDGYVDMLLYYYNLSAEADRTVIEDDDTVWVELYLYDEDGVELDDGSDHQGFVYIGSGQTYPELEADLIGKEVGQEYEIPITLADPYEYDETLSGQTITAKVTPEYIRDPEELTQDELTDELAGQVLDGATSVDDLRNQARTILMEQAQEQLRQTAYNVICDYLLDTCKVDPFPDEELKIRTDNNMEQIKTVCNAYYGITFDEYLSQIGMSEKEYRKEIEDSIRDTIKLEIIFTAIGDAEDIQYVESEFDAYIDEILAQYTYDSADEIYEEYGEDYVKSAFRIEYIVDWLISEADLTYTLANAE